MKNAIYWLAGGAAALYILARYSFGKKAVFIIDTLKTGGTVLQPTLKIGFIVQNPTNQRIIVRSIVGSLTVNNKFLANVSSFGDQIIQPNSESGITVTTRPSVLGVFNTVKTLINTPIRDLTVGFDGSANIDGTNVAINISQQI